jgi:ferredoxin
VNLRFYLLTAALTAALVGVLLSGFVAAIPVLTRGLLFSAGSVQLGLAKNWGMVPPFTPAIGFSLALFVTVFLLGLLGPRFWCRYVCPSGALLSLSGLLRGFQRQVDDRCVACGKCAAACPFDAIEPDFGTRTLSCAFCQTCGGVCPTEAIHFVPRSSGAPGSTPDVALGQPMTRRAMMASVAAGMAAAGLTRGVASTRPRPIRPPGSVAEDQFLDLCIRCEQCLKVCPGPVLQAAGLEHGLEALWTPVALFPHAGCHQDCNFCTRVCPTGAIRPLSPAEKRRFAMGLAVVDTATCLPHRGELDCRLCYEECTAAGYHAIEMRPVRLAAGPVPEGTFSPEEIEQMSQILAPFVKADACVGCGLCEYRCHSVRVSRQRRLRRSAVLVRAR